MNSSWQANKIGLVNFWYYDEQEFPFVKGRMLLRGSNGSGKSVTMQSVIPLLLDGNMSPERLDPFGSRDRKMSSYLLEEDDGREERIGYLYLEFKRKNTEVYATIGMGIRARRGKNLEKWYFSISDGRRIGKDFYLYKEMGERIPLSKKELENRLGTGGILLEKQAEYMEYVNRQFFGFEKVEEYKEMIDLLIQLRTPKLSKDFKPSVINEILSDSLQPLSDEDLRPMSEAIENMDTMNMNLKNRREAKQAAEKIAKAFLKYNQIVLLEKATLYKKEQDELIRLEEERTRNQEQIEQLKNDIADLEQKKLELEAKKEAKEKEKESLSISDAVKLKEREQKLLEELTECQKILKEKERFLEDKKERYLEIEYKIKEEEEYRYEKEEEIKELLQEMQSEAESMAFEEFSFMEQDVLEHLEESYEYPVHQQLFEKTKDKIAEGINVFEDVKRLDKQKDELLLKRERQMQEQDQAEKEIGRWESMLVQTRGEWKEALYKWNEENQELKLSDSILKEFSIFVDHYDENADFAQVRQQVADVWIARKNLLEMETSVIENEKKQLQKEKKETEAELKEWEMQKEPQPVRSEEILRNRQRLKEANIPYQEFYKVIEFGDSLDEVGCNLLEEALLRMGILDAIVVDEQYKEQVLKMEKGCADHYLFAGKAAEGQSLLDILELNEEVNNLFFHQQLNGILSGISYNENGNFSISTDGFYQMGILTGTLSGEYVAGFLGTKARERNRQTKIAECKRHIEELGQEIQKLEKELEILQDKKARLKAEYNAFPLDQDLRESVRALLQAEHQYENIKRNGEFLEKEILQLKEVLTEKKKLVLEISGKLYLECSYEVFKEAKRASEEYQKHLNLLQTTHTLVRQTFYMIENHKERIADLEMDLDQIRYDISTTQQEQRKKSEEYKSICQQLQLTDYEQIQEQLDACILWLKQYPESLEKCVEERAQKTGLLEILSGNTEEEQKNIQNCRENLEYFKKCYEAECNLGYVDFPEGKEKEVSYTVKYLKSVTRTENKDTIAYEVNKACSDNRGFLIDFQITQGYLFQELEDPDKSMSFSPRRIDITAQYAGMKISLSSLLAHLTEDIENLESLIKDGDRELFEDILANTVSRKIRGKINSSIAWVDKMNRLMNGMNTSSGLKLSLRWRSKTAEKEDQLDTRELIQLLKKDYRMMSETEAEKLSAHFRSKVREARQRSQEQAGMISFYQVMKETLDYRNWFEFQLFSQKNGERQKELTNSVFGTFSGGEKAMSMYVPLFSAVTAKYQGGNSDAPRLISLDEAFAGVDNRNIRDMFRLMAEFQFNFIINSQVLWGDSDTLDALAIYQLIRPENAKFVTVMSYLWNGKTKEMLESEADMEDKGKVLEDNG